MLARRKARNSLLDFAAYASPGYLKPPHLRRLAAALEDVEAGRTTRLIVSMPPRHGKSRLCSVLFPAWAMGRTDRFRVGIVGYGSEIARMHSRDCREIFVGQRYHAIFPHTHGETVRVQADRRVPARHAAEEWRASNGASLIATGVGGPLTGRGLDIAIIDDPLKDRADAASRTVRQGILDWYRSTLYTRLEPGGRIVVVMTRWDPDDLVGFLEREAAAGTGDQWTTIRLPAVDDRGQPLWPERYSAATLDGIRQAVGSFEWSALYQQQPRIRGGNRLKADDDHIQIHKTLDGWPAQRHTRAWDLASTAKQRDRDDPDYTCGALGTVTTERDPATGADLAHLWIRDVKFCREEAPTRNRIIVETAEADGPGTRVLVENFGAYKDAHAEIRDILRGRRVVQGIALPGDKSVKASPLEPVFEAGHVHLYQAPWNALWIQQHADFTGRDGQAHDDSVDTSAILIHEHDAPAASMAIPHQAARFRLRAVQA